jgi:Cu2+-exporting ATPase
LTEPQLALAGVETFNGLSRQEALRLAASLARESRHPAARAIVAAYADKLDAASEVNSQTGFGISGKVAGRELRLGRADFAVTAGQVVNPACADATLLADDNGVIAAFNLNERLRPSAAVAIDALQQQGLSVHIASGDAATKVAEIAARLGNIDWRARQLPADKLDWLIQLRANGARVIAVGDGVNDAPVLAGADVAIALAGGADLAQATSDIVLVGERLDALAPARALAQQTLAILKQNQRWALIYNLTAVPLAAMGLVPPWLAALGMSMSSLCVILNAMRIGRISPHRVVSMQVERIEHPTGVA